MLDPVLLGQALAHPVRIRLLQVMQNGKFSVTELARQLGLSHGLTSYHLAKLYDAHVVTFEPVGRLRIYWRTDDGFRCLGFAPSRAEPVSPKSGR